MILFFANLKALNDHASNSLELNGKGNYPESRHYITWDQFDTKKKKKNTQSWNK